MRLCIFLLIFCLPGCLSLTCSKRTPEPELLPVPQGQPRELQKTMLPDYTIEAPDILRIEVTRLIPRSPYLLGPGDGLLVQAARPDGTLLINELLHVELDGTLQFGSPFDDPNQEIDPALRIDGPITVAGLVTSDARKLIAAHIAKTISDPSVRVSLNEFANQQGISGEHLVASDGTVNLGTYGRVRVTGLTIDEARDRIDEHLSNYLQNPNTSVDVYAYNSKTYYIILQGAGLGDRVMQFPVTGNETVLDALSNVEGLSGTSSEEIWIARPGQNIFGGPQVLPVNWGAITQLADTSSNYQILPGDRVFVREDSLIAMDTHIGKFIAPLERIFGVVLLGTNTASRIQFYKQFGQNGGGGGGVP
ncbi:MAG: polysaccharide biosynthesis/export family protein [Planctomycetales bacterium]|nr:polysaccharide biosynthesis/export family protein [Planctomycetales bacterium]